MSLITLFLFPRFSLTSNHTHSCKQFSTGQQFTVLPLSFFLQQRAILFSDMLLSDEYNKEKHKKSDYIADCKQKLTINYTSATRSCVCELNGLSFLLSTYAASTHFARSPSTLNLQQTVRPKNRKKKNLQLLQPWMPDRFRMT